MLRDRAGKRTTRQALAALPAQLVVSALLAQRYAGIVDRADADDDGARVIAAGEKLRAVLATLELEESKAPKGGVAGDGKPGVDGGGQLYSILDRGPSVGDGAHA